MRKRQAKGWEIEKQIWKRDFPFCYRSAVVVVRFIRFRLPEKKQENSNPHPGAEKSHQIITEMKSKISHPKGNLSKDCIYMKNPIKSNQYSLAVVFFSSLCIYVFNQSHKLQWIRVLCNNSKMQVAKTKTGKRRAGKCNARATISAYITYNCQNHGISRITHC